MSTRKQSADEDPIISSREQLISLFQDGEKPADAWKIGTEHEKFVYRTADHRAPSYDEPGGIRDMLEGLEAYGWTPIEEGGKVIALSGKDGAISLEPAGQLELSGVGEKNGFENLYQGAVVPKGSEFGGILRDGLQILMDNGTYAAVMKKWGLGNNMIEKAGINLAGKSPQ